MPIHFALLGRKRKYVKSKKTAKLSEKRTLIAAVRAKLGQFDIFQIHLLSGCRLPLKTTSSINPSCPNLSTHSYCMWCDQYRQQFLLYNASLIIKYMSCKSIMCLINCKKEWRTATNTNHRKISLLRSSLPFETNADPEQNQEETWQENKVLSQYRSNE